MKVLRNICPLLFLLLSLACAAYTTVQIREYQRNLPGGVLAVLDKEEGAEQDFLIVEKEDGSPLYKNGAVEKIQKKYGITVLEDDLTELDPVKSLLSQSWKLYLAGVYLLAMLCIWKAAMGCIVRGYTECKDQKILKTTVRICSGVFLYLVSVGIWYLLICFIDIPQQYLPIAGIWDVGYVVDEIREFYRESEGIAGTIPYIGEIRTAGSFALRGYIIAIILFIPFWIRILFFKVKRKVFMNEKIYWKK